MTYKTPFSTSPASSFGRGRGKGSMKGSSKGRGSGRGKGTPLRTTEVESYDGYEDQQPGPEATDQA